MVDGVNYGVRTSIFDLHAQAQVRGFDFRALGTVFVVGYGVHLLNGWRINRRPVGARGVAGPARVSS